MYKLEFTLKQHTPIIHFQHDQDGATLRATEVKPKLDRFVLTQLGKGVYEKGIETAIKNKWIIGDGEHPTLDYKIRIITDESSNNNDITGGIEKRYEDNRGNNRKEKFPTFFGSMGSDNAEKWKFKFYDEINITIITKNIELKNEINNRLAGFFISTNFGNRQSKGFGSFYPEDADTYPIVPLKYYFNVDTNKLPRPRYNYIDEIPQTFRQYFRLFEVINLFYSTLRSGINQSWGQNPIYFKSLLFLYAKEKLNVQWDKKTIKEVLFNKQLIEQKTRYQNSDIIHYSSPDKVLLRDLLGLASESQWYGEYKDAIKTESIEKDKIERFKSPLFFKPVKTGNGMFRIYFHGVQESLNGMTGKRFKISKNDGKSFEISTPAKFNIDDFLRFAFATNLEVHIKQKGGGGFSPEKELLKNIYSQIRTNVGIIQRA